MAAERRCLKLMSGLLFYTKNGEVYRESQVRPLQEHIDSLIVRNYGRYLRSEYLFKIYQRLAEDSLLPDALQRASVRGSPLANLYRSLDRAGSPELFLCHPSLSKLYADELKEFVKRRPRRLRCTARIMSNHRDKEQCFARMRASTLYTRQYALRINRTSDNLCRHCHLVQEDIQHLFFGCPNLPSLPRDIPCSNASELLALFRYARSIADYVVCCMVFKHVRETEMLKMW